MVRWVRNPLLTLGCRDVVERIEMAKVRDPQRQRIAELFRTWWHHHKNTLVTVADLAEPIKHMVDPKTAGGSSSPLLSVSSPARAPLASS